MIYWDHFSRVTHMSVSLCHPFFAFSSVDSVAKRNYRYFVGFLFLVCALDLYILFFSVFLLGYSTHHEFDGSFGEAVKHYPVSIVMTVVAFVFLWCLGSLFGYHFFLIIHNLTTNEYIKQSRAERAARVPTPHASGGTNSNQIQSEPLHPTPVAPTDANNIVQTPIGRRDSATDKPSCYDTCHAFLCVPIPQSRFNLEEWIASDIENPQSSTVATAQSSPIASDQPSIGRNTPSLEGEDPFAQPVDPAVQQEMQRSRYEYDQRRSYQQRQLDMHNEMQARLQFEATTYHPPPAMGRSSFYYSNQPMPSTMPSSIPLISNYASSLPYSMTTINSHSIPLNNLAQPPSSSPSQHDARIQETRSRTLEVEREIQAVQRE